MARPSDFLTFFSTYLSQEVTQKEGEARLDCPFLDCENPSNHFYANLEDGTWTCKRCDKAGNTRTLITLLHEQFLETTTPSQYHSLSEVRGLRGATLENAGFAYDHINNRWLVPYYTYNPETNDWSPFLNNLGYFYPYSANEDSRFVIKKGKGLALYLYNPGLHQYPPSDTAIICEGEWDTLAYVEIDPDSTELILGKPGAGFKVDYLRTLSKTKKVYLFLDNDDAGRKQTATSIKVLQNDISNISTLDWTLVQDAPNDIRDLYLIQGEDTLSIIQRALVQYDISRPVEKEILKSYQTTLEDYTAVEDFDTYISNMKKHLYLTSESILSMAAVLGITNSISIPGEPLWVFLVGPPSAGKTQFIDSFGGNNERFDNLSKITAKALVSGWKDETGEEASYIEKLPGKTLFIKDFTATLSDSLEIQREVFGLLTDIFDGYVKIPYGNNQVKEFYDIHFNLVAAVTDIVHKHSAATIGERFLRIDWLGRNYDSRQFATRALRNLKNSKQNREFYLSNTLGFVNHLSLLPIPLEIEEKYETHIVDLAEFIATLRTKVESDVKEGIRYRPRAELPSRLAVQLGKLFLAIRPVFSSNLDSEEDIALASVPAFEVIKKIALDTCYGFPLDLLRTINENPLADRSALAKKANIEPIKAHRVLRDLETTGVITHCAGRVGSKGGRPTHLYDINPKLKPVLSYGYKVVRKGKPKRSPGNSRPYR